MGSFQSKVHTILKLARKKAIKGESNQTDRGIGWQHIWGLNVPGYAKTLYLERCP